MTPLITIITSTLNAGRDLHHTINSIRGQTFKNFEWIIVDGVSVDNTSKLVNAASDVVTFFISEKDDGIYDAWNKALRFARGEWVQFIGAGDELASPDALGEIANVLFFAHPKYDLVYGRLQYISEKSRVVLEEVGQPWSSMKGKWEFFRPKLPVHPEVFHHISLFRDGDCFDKSYKIAGDSHFLMRCIKKKDPLYVPILIDRMPLGGISGSIRRAYTTSLETKRASIELGYKIPIAHFATETLKTYCKILCCFLLSDRHLFKVANAFRILAGKRRRWL